MLDGMAYTIPGAPGDGSDFIRKSRLWPMGGWTLRPMSGGVVAFQGTAWSPEMAGPHRLTQEGWTYYAPKVLPTIHGLTRPTRPEAAVVHLLSGTPILVPIAMASPRSLLFDGAGGVSDKPAQEWAHRAMALWNTDIAADAEIVRTIFLALSSCYRLTEELLSDLALLTEADIEPVLSALWGREGKAEAGAGGGSPSPAPATTCPSPVPMSSSSPTG